MTFLEQILLTIVTAFATASLAYFGFWRQTKAELQKQYQARFNEKKWELYTAFIRAVPILVEMDRLTEMQQYQTLSAESQIKLDSLSRTYQDIMNRVENDILLIGSPKVVKLFLEWNIRTSLIDKVKSEYAVEVFFPLLNAMREDLDIGESKLNSQDLDGLYFFSTKKRESIDKVFENQFEAKN